MSQQKSDLDGNRVFILFFRLTMGWTFLWAAIHHFGGREIRLGLSQPREDVSRCLSTVH
jgi:hypothetical protein